MTGFENAAVGFQNAAAGFQIASRLQNALMQQPLLAAFSGATLPSVIIRNGSIIVGGQQLIQLVVAR